MPPALKGQRKSSEGQLPIVAAAHQPQGRYEENNSESGRRVNQPLESNGLGPLPSRVANHVDMGEEVQFHSHTACPVLTQLYQALATVVLTPPLLASGAEVPSTYEALVKTLSGTGLLRAALPSHVREQERRVQAEAFPKDELTKRYGCPLTVFLGEGL